MSNKVWKSTPFVAIFVIILFVILGGYACIRYYPNWGQVLTGTSAAIQAVATIVLVWVTCIYVDEIQKGREQQLRPIIDIFFYWDKYIEKFIIVLKNTGPGPARDVKYSYKLQNDNGKEITDKGSCQVLGAGDEMGDESLLTKEHLNASNKVTAEVSYKDLFDTESSGHFDLSLKELARKNPPSKHAEERRRRYYEAQKDQFGTQ